MAGWCSITCVVIISMIMTVSGASIRSTAPTKLSDEKSQNHKLLSLVLVLTKMVEEMVKKEMPNEQPAFEAPLHPPSKSTVTKSSGSHHPKDIRKAARRMNSYGANVPGDYGDEESRGREGKLAEASPPAEVKRPPVKSTTESQLWATSPAPETQPPDASLTSESKPFSDSPQAESKPVDASAVPDSKLVDKPILHGPMTSYLGTPPILVAPPVQKDVSPAYESAETISSEDSSEDSLAADEDSKLLTDSAPVSEESLSTFCEMLAEYPDVAKQFEYELMDIQRRFYEALVAQRVGKASLPPAKEKGKAHSGAGKAETRDCPPVSVPLCAKTLRTIAL